MANLSNKKFFIPLAKLPYPNIDGKHRVRFRITTQDRNEISEWSPIYSVDSPVQQASASVAYQVQQTGTIVTISWLPNILYKEYDVFVSLGGSSLDFFTRTANTSININVSGVSIMRMWVQLPSYPYPPSTSTLFRLFDTGTISV